VINGSELIHSLGSHLTGFVAHMLTSPAHMVAGLAAAVGVGLVLAGALTRTMLPLRWLAVGSNVGLLAYGVLQPSPLTMIVSLSLLPINLFRAVEVTRLTRRVTRAGVQADMAALWLRPHMKARRFKAGRTLFTKGDAADRLYLLAEGQLELTDIGVPLHPGRIFGEVALFSPGHHRTHTIRCITDCIVLEIHENTVRQLFFQHPAFAFHLVQLLAQRLGEDVQRAQSSSAPER
jgi:CRP/FNR family cyclic AMP-dependent transcriptional regulator